MKRKKVLSIKRLVGLCNRIEDPRRAWGNKRHELTTILIIALLSIISGCESWEEIHDYGKVKRAWLRTFLPLPNGIPSESTFRRVFARLEPEALEEVYRQWVWPYVGSCLNKQICVDGKTVCGVNRRSDAKLHMVSAWVREDGIALGQIRTEEKSNEIAAIPKLLESLTIRGGCGKHGCDGLSKGDREKDRRSGGAVCVGREGQPANPARGNPRILPVGTVGFDRRQTA